MTTMRTIQLLIRNPAICFDATPSAVVPTHAGTHIPEAGIHGSPQRGPCDASVAGCPARGRHPRDRTGQRDWASFVASPADEAAGAREQQKQQDGERNRDCVLRAEPVGAEAFNDAEYEASKDRPGHAAEPAQYADHEGLA